MKDFYKHLNKSEGKSEALRNAQLSWLSGSDEITSHPFYWAGYISIGNNNPLTDNNLYLLWGIILVALVLVLALLTSTTGKRLIRR